MFITGLIIYIVIRSVLFGMILWLLDGLQKFNYNVPGLFGSSVLACVLDCIPFVGHACAILWLYASLYKNTKACLMPDLAFTVAVGYALMFAVKMLLITFLGPPLHLATDFAGASNRPHVVMADPVGDFVTNESGTNRARAHPPTSSDDWLQEVSVKGVTENGKKSSVLVSADQKIYTLLLGENIEVRTAAGARRMRLLEVSETWATVVINGETNYLRIH
jgi:hypothetical protein